MKIFCISGKAGSGKDTVASMMWQMLTADGNRVLITHYADLVKYICRTFFGWDGEKDEQGRELLQYVGTDVVRTHSPDYWVAFLGDMLRFFGDRWDYVLIPDARFHNEISYLKQQGHKVTHLHIVRNDMKSRLTECQQNHPSETALDNVVADHYIENDGTLPELFGKLSQLLADINGYHQMSFDELTQW